MKWMMMLWLGITLTAFVYAVDEDELFGDTETITDSKKIVNNEAMNEGEKKSLGISGSITSVNTYTLTREWWHTGDDNENSLHSYMSGNLLLDARLKRGIKGFANLEVEYTPDTGKTQYWLRELFLDFNYKNIVYFRTGKQVLQWGRCYFFNPTDLVNVEKKSFIEKVGSREGAYGVKMHVPFGTKANMYGFIDTGKADNADTLAGAYKFEWLMGETEMALAVWAKKGFHPVYGYDISTRIFKIDVTGEIGVSYGDNYPFMTEHNGVLYREKKTDEWVPKVALGLSKSFDVGDVKDKVSVVLEGYYNHRGYDENVLEDSSLYFYDEPITIDGVVVPAGTKAAYFYGHDLYEPNNYGKYYLAMFTTVSKFITSDISLNINGIANMSDHSAILSTGLSYIDINDLSASLTVSGYLGEDDREFTFMGNAMDIRLTVGILF